MRKQFEHSELEPFNDMHSRQSRENRFLGRPGKVMVRVRSTLLDCSSCLKLTMGDRARLAGEIQTRGAGNPLAAGLNWTGSPMTRDDRGSSLLDLGVPWSVALALGVPPNGREPVRDLPFVPWILTMGESGKLDNSLGVMTWPTSCRGSDGGGGTRSKDGCSGSCLNLATLLPAATGGRSCSFSSVGGSRPNSSSSSGCFLVFLTSLTVSKVFENFSKAFFRFSSNNGANLSLPLTLGLNTLVGLLFIFTIGEFCSLGRFWSILLSENVTGFQKFFKNVRSLMNKRSKKIRETAT